MAGYSPERGDARVPAPRRPEPAGLDELARRVAERRRELPQKHNLDGTLQEIKELLDQAVLAEREQLARDVEMDDADRMLAEMQLDNLPASPAAAVSELSQYDWKSREARSRLREDQRPARSRDARPAFRGHEEGARERDRRGPRGDQRDARRPQQPARGASAAGKTPRNSSTSSCRSTATTFRRIRRTSTSCSTRSPSEPQRPSGCATR